MQLKIVDLLNTGKEKAIPREQLQKALGLNERELYKKIERERREGKLILSQKENGGGYYLPSNNQEKSEYLHTAMNDIISNLKTYYGVKYGGRFLDNEIIEMLKAL